jgi:hypothetical protein
MFKGAFFAFFLILSQALGADNFQCLNVYRTPFAASGNLQLWQAAIDHRSGFFQRYLKNKTLSNLNPASYHREMSNEETEIVLSNIYRQIVHSYKDWFKKDDSRAAQAWVEYEIFKDEFSQYLAQTNLREPKNSEMVKQKFSRILHSRPLRYLFQATGTMPIRDIPPPEALVAKIKSDGFAQHADEAVKEYNNLGQRNRARLQKGTAAVAISIMTITSSYLGISSFLNSKEQISAAQAQALTEGLDRIENGLIELDKQIEAKGLYQPSK